MILYCNNSNLLIHIQHDRLNKLCLFFIPHLNCETKAKHLTRSTKPPFLRKNPLLCPGRLKELIIPGRGTGDLSYSRWILETYCCIELLRVVYVCTIYDDINMYIYIYIYLDIINNNRTIYSWTNIFQSLCNYFQKGLLVQSFPAGIQSLSSGTAVDNAAATMIM